jgi:hypothetical protein
MCGRCPTPSKIFRSGCESGPRRHTICDLLITYPDDVVCFKGPGVLANGTPLGATDYDGLQIDLYEKRLGKQRLEDRLLPLAI